MGANPTHSGAKLAMAQITLYEKGYEEAKALIDQALSAAKNTQNDDEQFRAFWLKAMLADAQQNLEEKGYALSRALELRSDDERTALELAGLLVVEEESSGVDDRKVFVGQEHVAPCTGEIPEVTCEDPAAVG